MENGKIRKNCRLDGCWKKVFAAMDGQAAKGIRLLDWREKTGVGAVYRLGNFWFGGGFTDEKRNFRRIFGKSAAVSRNGFS